MYFNIYCKLPDNIVFYERPILLLQRIDAQLPDSLLRQDPASRPDEHEGMKPIEIHLCHRAAELRKQQPLDVTTLAEVWVGCKPEHFHILNREI